MLKDKGKLIIVYWPSQDDSVKVAVFELYTKCVDGYCSSNKITNDRRRAKLAYCKAIFSQREKLKINCTVAI